MQLRSATKPSVLWCHLVNTNEDLGGLAATIPLFDKLIGTWYYCCCYCGCRTKGAVVEVDWSQVGDDVDMDMVCARQHISLSDIYLFTFSCHVPSTLPFFILLLISDSI